MTPSRALSSFHITGPLLLSISCSDPFILFSFFSFWHILAFCLPISRERTDGCAIYALYKQIDFQFEEYYIYYT